MSDVVHGNVRAIRDAILEQIQRLPEGQKTLSDKEIMRRWIKDVVKADLTAPAVPSPTETPTPNADEA